MKRLIQVSVAAVVFLVGAGHTPADDKKALTISAWMTNAGPYGEMWDLAVVPGDGPAQAWRSGAASLKVSYMLNPIGSVEGHFEVAEEKLGTIRAAAEAQGFFDLPAELAPDAVALHMPDLRLDITVGGKQHKVTVYDPAQLARDARVQRFLSVWKAVFSVVPLKPSW